ncbi:hypothetical protein ACFE04_021008 [Oxalis oulophora]
MVYTSITPVVALPSTCSSCFYPIIIIQQHQQQQQQSPVTYNLHLNNNKPYSTLICSNNLRLLNNNNYNYNYNYNCCQEEKEEEEEETLERRTKHIQNTTFYNQLYSLNNHLKDKQNPQNPVTQITKQAQKSKLSIKIKNLLFINMWWPDFKAAMGQRINIEGIVNAASVFAKNQHLALPHLRVPDINYIDWGELQNKGFKGVVFDKDNTITAPYSLKVWPPVNSALDDCKELFGNDIAVYSNSAGLSEYDHNGLKAKALERAIGIKVIRHKLKKPAGTAEEIEKHFGCESSRLIMVGDRPFTDIVFGNRNGFLTILTEPLSLPEEPFIVRQVRKLEVALVNCWFRRGFKPTTHILLSDPMQCVKDPPRQQSN